MGNQFYRRVFAPDCGVLQLIRVLEMRDGDWERLLNYLSTSYPCEYSEDGVVVSLPSIDEIIGTRKKVSTFLEFDIDGTRVSSHFPDRHRVQIDLRPEDVTSCERADAILQFMVNISYLLSKRVLLTYQWGGVTSDQEVEDMAICVVDPTNNSMTVELRAGGD